ncbi:MAG: ABC transporter ATP-binding protein [Chloroflexi bacterium]|nr:ABC transporter ATP-binding protein [Chloroflexota bacterium]
MIKLSNFTFYYTDAEKPALKDVNLEVQDGEFVLVTGPSGGGKSTFCRCLNGLVPHFYGGRLSGQVELQGLDTRNHTPREMATKVGMVFQDPENQFVAMDVEREIAFGLENLALPKNLLAKRIEESLDTLNISHLRHRTVHELSGGEKQKVAIASVLALHPDILVLDEPTSELDPRSAEEVLSILERLNDELGITIVLVEHRLDRVVQYADRLVVIDQGRVVANGDVRKVLNNRYSELVEIGVGVPSIVRLAHELKKKGFSVNGVPLSVKEARAILGEIWHQARIQKIDGEKKDRGEGNPVIQTKKLWHVYPEGPAALRNIDLKIHEGEFVAIIGRNASGKTTLVKHLNGLLQPTRGTVTVDGNETRMATVADLARMVGFVFQNPNDHLFADTVEEEIAFALKNRGASREVIGAKVDEMLERFRITEYRKEYPRSLSGGERQRVAMASVLVTEPDILVMDEPTRGMDYKLKSELMGFLRRYTRQGKTVILITHDIETVAEYADRVILLSEGQIVVDGTRHEVLSGALLFSPQVNRLVQSWTEHGVPGDILTVDELMRVLG